MPDMMSAKSPPPGSPMTPCANACPRPVLPRWLARSTAKPASASTTPFGSDSEKYVLQHQVGPPWTAAISGSGPLAPCGVISQPSISRPSGAVQRIGRASGQTGSSAMSASLKVVRRVHSRAAGSKRAISGGTPCASWVVRIVAAPVAHRALWLDDVPADERVAGPDLVPAAVQPDPARGRPEAVVPCVPERIVVAPRREADGLEVGPRIRDRAVLEIDDLDAAAEQARVARVALDDRGPPAVGRHGQTLEVPGRLVQGPRGPVRDVERDDPRVVPAVAARRVGDDRHDRRLVDQVELPDALAGRADLVDGIRLQVDAEQAAPGLVRPTDLEALVLGPQDRPGGEVEPVETGVGGHHEQVVAVGRPRHGFRRARERRREDRLPVERHRVRQLVARRRADPTGTRSERHRATRPASSHPSAGWPVRRRGGATARSAGGSPPPRPPGGPRRRRSRRRARWRSRPASGARPVAPPCR